LQNWFIRSRERQSAPFGKCAPTDVGGYLGLDFKQNRRAVAGPPGREYNLPE
jgi:hypothetical protein